MSVWRVLETCGIVAAVCVGGAAAGVSAAWALSRIARRWGTDETPMGAIRQTFPKLTPKEADAVRKDASRRRARAADRHAEGVRIETGEPDQDRGDNLIKLVERA